VSGVPDFDSTFTALCMRSGALLAERRITAPRIVGIQTGGVWLAERLAASLGIESPIGRLDISFHRDDYEHAGLHPVVRPSVLPWPVDGAHLLLVDDVLFTGRTVRAALNELFDWGRPASVMLAVLIDRGGRELPITPDACGARVVLPAGAQVRLRGPEPLAIEQIGPKQ
jgi:pyrimidine operon attenuation protein/uracil phosphoribosyltransferase